MEKRKVNKDNPKNRYCSYCIHWNDKMLNPCSWIDRKYYICKNTLKHIGYYDCCNEFEPEGD